MLRHPIGLTKARSNYLEGLSTVRYRYFKVKYRYMSGNLDEIEILHHHFRLRDAERISILRKATLSDIESGTFGGPCMLISFRVK